MTINALADEMVMDRTTLGRNILPLEREGLITIRQGAADRRSKELDLTDAGVARLRQAIKAWTVAQTRFEQVFGNGRSARLRASLRDVAATDLGIVARETSGGSVDG
jgi:DNA-binding MarR family transcriptional regulator